MIPPLDLSDSLDTIANNGQEVPARNTIRIRGARQHNLKNVDLELPRDRLVVFTGPQPAIDGGNGNGNLRLPALAVWTRGTTSLSALRSQHRPANH